MKFAVERVIKQYIEFKEESTRFSATDFYQTGAVDLKKWKAQLTFSDEMPDLVLPPKEMLYFPPFLSKIAEEENGNEIWDVQELQTRDFLQSILRGQIQANGKKVAERFYTEFVTHVMKPMVADKFGIPISKLLNMMEKEAENADPTSEDAMPLLFLQKPNFINMYVGGTVLACVPMLDAVVGATLLDKNKCANDKEYTRRLKRSIAQYDAMFQASFQNPGTKRITTSETQQDIPTDTI